jgi:hypothetical protein
MVGRLDVSPTCRKLDVQDHNQHNGKNPDQIAFARQSFFDDGCASATASLG